ncbi:phosphotransferase enzyme family protein [Mangrovicoccus algicola]|uniref:Phosphotransferase n=1 Tax=Mangrovicoccus algicola TaxID=2771008 RepID=A0A8J6YUI5_9RHOB|nr:phosphotransferase [Mangrovicoccus algicola]MBE3637975.1 phosphotransferase [Mangrovicoccus algicola]
MTRSTVTAPPPEGFPPLLYQDAFINRLTNGLSALIPEWNLSPETTISLLTVSENATFIARDPRRDRPLILRVHRPDYHQEAEILSELAWIEALRAADAVETPAPVPTRSGALLGRFRDGADLRHVAAFEFMEGAEPDADAGLVPGFRLLGAISARLHAHAETWPRPPAFTRKTWDFDSAFGSRPLWGDWRAAIGLGPGGQDLLERACARLKTRLDAYGKGPDRFGLVHADLRLANLLAREEALGVIDFDDCGFSWFVYDFAAAISFHELNPIVPELQAAWLDGYRELRPLAEEHAAMIPDFIMFRRLLLTAWIASHAETATAAEAGHGTYTEGTLEMARAYLGASA